MVYVYNRHHKVTTPFKIRKWKVMRHKFWDISFLPRNMTYQDWSSE